MNALVFLNSSYKNKRKDNAVSQKGHILFNQTFEEGNLSLTVQLNGLIDKTGMNPRDVYWYNNSSELVLEFRSYEGEKKPWHLLVKITTSVDNIMYGRFKKYLVSIKDYMIFLYFEHRKYGQEKFERGFITDTFDDLVILADRAIRKDKKVTDYHHFEIGSL